MPLVRTTLLYLAAILTAAHSLPATTNSTLLQSGEAAQALNAQFSTLTTSSPCGNLSAACVSGAIATCTNDAWDITKGTCSNGNSCFALPNLRTGGTTLQCTSPKNALSVIQSTGAAGDVTGANSGDASGTGSTTAESSRTFASPTRDPSPTETPDGRNSGGVTVTVTVTMPILTTPITTTRTRTILPEEASSIIASVINEGGEVTPVDGTDQAEETGALCTETGGMHGERHKHRMTRTSSASATETAGQLSTPAVATPSSGTPATLTMPSATAASGPSGGY